VRVEYGEVASDDVVRQLRYYLLDVNVPEVALGFQNAVAQTLSSLRSRPYLGPRFFSDFPHLRNLRSWPIAGFEVIRIYYRVDTDVIQVIRVLHGMRNVRRILENE
jgi:plasmid stabilization system protein ParE